MKYNLDNLKKLHHLYLPSDEQKADIIQDVLGIHLFLKYAHQATPKFPDIAFMKESIRFYNPRTDDPHAPEYCTFSKTPLTPTGKHPKFPLVLNYHIGKGLLERGQSSCMFGEIFYLENGNIGKIKIILWVKKDCYIVNVALKNKKLVITKIEKSDTTRDNYARVVLYKL